MSRALDYSKWDHIEVSDDEDDIPTSQVHWNQKKPQQQENAKEQLETQPKKKTHELKSSDVNVNSKVIADGLKKDSEEKWHKRHEPDPEEVMNSLPAELQECFETRNVALLQQVLSKLPKDDATSHMQRCVDSGLWILPTGTESTIKGTLLKGEFSHPTDVLYNRACTITRLMLSPVTTVIKNVINESLNHWNEDFIGLLLEDRDILSLRIATVPDMVETFLTFADYLFLETGSKHRCFWSLNQTFALWSSTTPLMQQLLVEKGLMIGVLLELEAFRNCPSSEDMTYLVQLTLSILCNLLQVPANVAYFMNTECDRIVQFFTKSNDSKTRILSISVLCYLESKFTLDRHHLEIKRDDIRFMIDLIQTSISECSAILRPVSLLRALHVIVKISETNGQRIISQGLMPVISGLVESHDRAVQKEVILILWAVASYSTSEFDLSRIVDSLKSGLLVTANKCALWDISEQSKDYVGYIAFANDCYQLDMYERCFNACGKILQISSSDSDIKKTSLLKGKSLFHLCNKNINKLPKQISPNNLKVNKILTTCIEYATEAVNLLGFAHDHNCIDEEGSKYLDLCMMFLISSVNALNKCQRCLLCLSNLKLRKSTVGVKQYKGLQHSHVVPKAILEAFSSGLIKTSSRRIFRFCGTEKILSQLKSAKEGTWFILCSNCEQLFGVFEEQFVNSFFKKIYDVSNPTSPLQAQKIEYGRWLYQFCISIFFRGVAVLDIPCNDSMKRFQNSEKLYEIFLRCRQILLAPCNSSRAILYPSAHVLINSTSPTPEESQLYTTIHEVLVSPEMLSVAAGKDSKDCFVGPSKANLFLAHMGIINVVIDVESVIPSKDHSVSPIGGSYHIPHDNDRNRYIPPDVKECFYTSARQMEVQKETISDKLRKSHWAKGIVASPPNDREQTFMVHPAQRKDSEVLRQGGVRPSQHSSKIKVMNFLPPELNLVRRSGLVEHPPGHRVLFHCEPDRSQYQGSSSSFDKGITLFLAIGDGSKRYPADKPYAIYHRYDPGLEFNMAMFVSSVDLSVTTLITDGSPQHTAEMLFKDTHFRQNIQQTLRAALYQMGFGNFRSFLTSSQEKRVQSKCQTKRRCWYCINRCDNCMEVAAFGLTKQTKGVIVKFCSDICGREFTVSPKILNLLPDIFSYDNGKILPPAGHKILQCVTDHFDEEEEMLAATHTSCICVGNSLEFPRDKVYITYTISTVLRQTLLAFFIADDFTINSLTIQPDVEVTMWFSESIRHNVHSVLESVVSETSFSSFKAWRTAAIQ